MRVDLFDFELPESRIALSPVTPRDASRLLFVDKSRIPGLFDHRFSELPTLLRKGDLLVFNDTRVIPSQLTGLRPSCHGKGATIKATLHQKVDSSSWRSFIRPAKYVKQGTRLIFGNLDIKPYITLIAEVSEKNDKGQVVLSFDREGQALHNAINQLGTLPLPPYILKKRSIRKSDLEEYQTIYARYPGAVAAPTAGLHFTQDLCERLLEKEISYTFLTLHVGAGTFLPIRSSDTKDHKMHSEWGMIDEHCVKQIKQTRRSGGRIVAVGTTVLRLLESATDTRGHLRPFKGTTNIFIQPGYQFRSADMLITNFHLPRSTLFMLVCAFAGYNLMKKAYVFAVEKNYRFYSYGDACLLHHATVIE
ncbi:MAG: tRNA preQ1(34) S-adenosylmethionine ribosyltransferase-isomerase QueA [Alphaproteobacteria bacterium]|nr:tRNA preQ1(34) S-adenosylmethionine ribosyltransferase-isomerase QueA [Alphaproteobacteria bacterium]